MAYELVDAVQLNNDLLDIADAIRAKSQGQDPLLFPSEFISEIGSIPTGASITGARDVTVKAMSTTANGDTLYISEQYQIIPKHFQTLPVGNTSQCSFSPDGKRLAVVSESSPRVSIYNTQIIPFSRIANPASLPTTGYANGCAWSPDGTRLAVAFSASPRLGLWDTTTTPYTKLTNPGTLPTGGANGCAWSLDGTRLAIAHNTSPYITIYDTTTTPYTKLADPGTLPTGNANGCAWSPDGTRLAVCHSTSPFLTIYDTTTTPYTKLADPGTLPTLAGRDCCWSPDGSMLVVAAADLIVYDAVDYSVLYSVAGDNVRTCLFNKEGTLLFATGSTTGFTGLKVRDPSTFTTIASIGTDTLYYKGDISPDGDILAFPAHASPYLYAVNASATAKSVKANNLILDGAPSYGYAKQDIAFINTGTAAILFTP